MLLPLTTEVTIDDAYDLVMKSVEPLGQEYCQEVARYQERRWVDFAANSGKGFWWLCGGSISCAPLCPHELDWSFE